MKSKHFPFSSHSAHYVINIHAYPITFTYRPHIHYTINPYIPCKVQDNEKIFGNNFRGKIS